MRLELDLIDRILLQHLKEKEEEFKRALFEREARLETEEVARELMTAG